MKTKEEKTNVIRILEQSQVQFQTHTYLNTKAVSGQEVAAVLQEDPDMVFKTLVTVSKNNQHHYVFLVPVSSNLDLKKAASVVGEKSLEMLKSKELLSLTGYVHGGCSPIGMKKPFNTSIDESARNYPTIIFSGGKIGYQVEISLSELAKVIPINLANIKEDNTNK